MTEAREQTPIQGTRYEIASTIPRNAKGERIGTGRMLDKVGHGLFGETVSKAVMEGLRRTGSIVEVSPDGVEQAENPLGSGYDNNQSKSKDITRLLQANEQQTTRALETTRSALQREMVAQEADVRPQPQDRKEGMRQPREAKVQKPERETEIITLRSVKDGHILESFIAPKNATSWELNQAAKAAGLDYRISPLLTILHGIGIPV